MRTHVLRVSQNSQHHGVTDQVLRQNKTPVRCAIEQANNRAYPVPVLNYEGVVRRAAALVPLPGRPHDRARHRHLLAHRNDETDGWQGWGGALRIDR